MKQLQLFLLILRFSQNAFVRIDIRQSAKKLEVDEQFSRLNGELGDLGKTVQRMNHRMDDLNVYRPNLTFTFEANITDLLVRDSKIGANAKLFSETFYIRGTPFYLRLSTFKTNISYLSIFLKSQVTFTDDADRPLNLQYELSILSHSGNARNANKTVKGERKFDRLPYIQGWSKFIAFTELMESGLVKRDAIKLQAILTTP